MHAYVIIQVLTLGKQAMQNAAGGAVTFVQLDQGAATGSM